MSQEFAGTDTTQTCFIASFIRQIFLEHLLCAVTALDVWNISGHNTEQDSSEELAMKSREMNITQ